MKSRLPVALVLIALGASCRGPGLMLGPSQVDRVGVPADSSGALGNTVGQADRATRPNESGAPLVEGLETGQKTGDQGVLDAPRGEDLEAKDRPLPWSTSPPLEPVSVERAAASAPYDDSPMVTLTLKDPLAPQNTLPQVDMLPGQDALPPRDAIPRKDALTLDGLEQIALESNPTLVQARMAVEAAQGGYLQAGLYPNPAIGYIADEIGNDRSAGLQGGALSQEIVTSGKLRLGRAVARWEVQQARHRWEAQRRRVLNDVRAGYYEVLLAQEMIELNEQLVDIGQKGVDVTEQLRPVEVSEADVLQARIEAETARLGLAEARNRHQAAWRRLAAVLGRPEMEPAALAGDLESGLPKLTWEDTLKRLLAQSPQIAQARAGTERARYELARQYAERVPNVEVGTAVKHDDGSHFTVADVELLVPLPLYDRNQGNIIKARAELSAANNELRRTELDLRDRLAAAFEQYANAREKVETYRRTILPDAERSLELTRKAWRLGEWGYLTLLTAQRTYFSVNLDYLDSLRELWARSVELEGMLLGGGLAGVE
jgi:cobalt-zinc-cadmium efflux system outer membrane protein